MLGPPRAAPPAATGAAEPWHVLAATSLAPVQRAHRTGAYPKLNTKSGWSSSNSAKRLCWLCWARPGADQTWSKAWRWPEGSRGPSCQIQRQESDGRRTGMTGPTITRNPTR